MSVSTKFRVLHADAQRIDADGDDRQQQLGDFHAHVEPDETLASPVAVQQRNEQQLPQQKTQRKYGKTLR